jgi:integrase
LSLICKKLHIKQKSPHKIRATYGTKLYDSGIKKSVICQQMGHTDISCLEKNYYFNRLDESGKALEISKVHGL